MLSVEQRELGQELACLDTQTPEQTRPEALLRGMKSMKPGPRHEPLQAPGFLAPLALPPGRWGACSPAHCAGCTAGRPLPSRGGGGRAQRPPSPPSRPVCLHAPFSTGPPLTAPTALAAVRVAFYLLTDSPTPGLGLRKSLRRPQAPGCSGYPAHPGQTLAGRLSLQGHAEGV